MKFLHSSDVELSSHTRMNSVSMDRFTRYAMFLSCLLNATLKGDAAISALIA